MLWVHCSLCPPASGFDFCIKSPKHCVHNNTMSVLWTKSIVGTHLEKHKTSVAKILFAIWVYLKLKFLFLFIRSLIKFSFCFKSWSTWGDWRDILIWVCWHFFHYYLKLKILKKLKSLCDMPVTFPHVRQQEELNDLESRQGLFPWNSRNMCQVNLQTL